MAKDKTCVGFVRKAGTYSGRGAGGPTPSFVTYGAPFYYAAENWATGTQWFLEVFMRAVTGTAYARLIDITSGSPVTGSQLSTTNADFQRIRGSALTLTDTHEYMGQLGKIGSDVGQASGSKVIGVSP